MEEYHYALIPNLFLIRVYSKVIKKQWLSKGQLQFQRYLFRQSGDWRQKGWRPRLCQPVTFFLFLWNTAGNGCKFFI